MRRSLVTLSLLCAGVASMLGARGAALAGVDRTLRYHNPVFSKPFPDPMVLRLSRHDYWAYGTTLPWQTGYFPILHSADFVHWKYMGDAFKPHPIWPTGDLWAPDVVRHGKTYYMYYTYIGTLNLHCIGVATAPAPIGPWKRRNTVDCTGTTGSGYIDPDLFVDTDGKAYLYISVDEPHTISMVPMKSDLRHPAGPATEMFAVSQDWEHGPGFTTVEGPFMVKRGSTYYLFYSGGDTGSAKYEMGYASSSSPSGPFTKYAGNPILRDTPKIRGPGGGSVVQGPNGKLWMVYHAWSGHVGFSRGDTRTMRIDPISWRHGVPSVAEHP